MLSAIVNAYIGGVRRDLYLVPVSIHYGRVVEEEAYRHELMGGKKQKESFGALVRARAVLRQKYGTVYVTFAEPISLHGALGERKERFHRAAEDPAVAEERRYFIQKLSFRILRAVNDVAVAGATSVSSTALLAAPRRAIRYADFVVAARALTQLLVSKGVTLTASLQRNLENFVESLNFLQAAELIEWVKDRDGDIIHVPSEQRMILDFYKNNVIHFFLVSSLVAHALRRGVTREALRDEVWWWLELFRWEFALPERTEVAAEIEETLAHFASAGASEDTVVRADHVLVAFADGVLDNFREAYWIAAKVLLDLEPEGLAHKAMIVRMQKSFEMHVLLEQVQKPEGSSAVTFANAISRFAELRCVTLARRGRREQVVLPGPATAALASVERRLAESLRAPSAAAPARVGGVAGAGAPAAGTPA